MTYQTTVAKEITRDSSTQLNKLRKEKSNNRCTTVEPSRVEDHNCE